MSKGQKKPSLRDLSRERPTAEEANKIRDDLDHASDVEVAITYAAFVEQELEDLIFYRLKIRDSEIKDSLTEDGGSLSTFYDMILLGKAIKLYGDEVEHNLNIVRRIRNVFAHSVKRVGFDHPLIAKELIRARMRPGLSKKWQTILKGVQAGRPVPRLSYLYLCADAHMFLMRRYSNLLQASNRYYRKKRERAATPWTNYLAGLWHPKSTPATSLQNQTVGSAGGYFGGFAAAGQALAVPPKKDEDKK